MEERRAQQSQWKNEERNEVNGRTKSATKSMEERRMQQSQWKNEERNRVNGRTKNENPPIKSPI